MSLDLRLSVPVAAAWLVAVLLIGTPQWAVMSAVVLWLAAGMATATALASRRSLMSSIALACALAALCSTSVAMHADSRQPDALNDFAARNTQVEVRGITTSTVRTDAEYFQAQLSSAGVNGQTVPLSSPALIFREGNYFGMTDADPAPPAHEWGIGVQFSVTGTLTATEPGDGRAVLVFASDEPQWRADPPAAVEWANQLRRTFATEAAMLPGGGGQLIGGLAIGDTAAVSEELDAAMKTSSLARRYLQR
ncbi:uncharacterized protein DUF4131 [Rhodoglobus vestalii]|uniref:Uncharacterized protein DUF4131 n=1 Tax=Rhodoglobus vestalii TaxID=193384 RepID=A0A8H2K8Y3_9MICO|nr:DUF4131 domain-containing protein [Rhodoglobus vestalii]TQO21078.1 uncharacterized protein DUF4131 [Rhodoglobus vestalii]